MSKRIIDRLDKFMSARRLNDSKVTKDAGLSQGTISRARDKGNDLSDRAAAKILETYTELNKDWLINGEGKMLITPSEIYNRLQELLKLEGVEIAELEATNNNIKGTFQRALLNTDINIARGWAEAVCSFFGGKYSFDWIVYGKRNFSEEEADQRILALEAEVAKLQEDNSRMLRIIENLSKK